MHDRLTAKNQVVDARRDMQINHAIDNQRHGALRNFSTCTETRNGHRMTYGGGHRRCREVKEKSWAHTLMG
jgi:hypothetical protein